MSTNASEPRDQQEIADSMSSDLVDRFGENIDLTRGSVFRALVHSVSAVQQEADERLRGVYEAAYLPLAEGDDLDRVVSIIGMSRREAVRATGWVRLTSDNPVSQDRIIPQGTIVSTGGTNAVRYETRSTVTMSSGTSQVDANIIAVNGGTDGNVAANTVTTLVDPPAFVDNVDNPEAIGDDSNTDLDGQTLVVGLDEETDEELRDRAERTINVSGAATHAALVGNLIDLDSVLSVTVLENKEGSTDADGLPPFSFEPIVLGGTEDEIAQTIYDTKAVTSKEVGGVNGTGVTRTVAADVNDQSFDIDFTRPNKIDLYITIDAHAEETYVGDDEVKNRIVRYIGGTLVDGTPVVGTGISEDVFIDLIKDRVVNDDTSIFGISSIDIEDSGGTDLTSTDTDGLEIVSVGQTETAQVDADNITLNVSTN